LARPIDLLVSAVILPHINSGKLAQIAREIFDERTDMLIKPFALDVLGAKVRSMILGQPS
jgi:hypothetical protein